MESILTSIKKLLGITEDDKSFDMDVIIHINSVFSTLYQLGVGPEKCFSIQDEISTWSDFTSDVDEINSVKTYTYLKVKLVFDPPLSSTTIAAYEREAKEYEYRLTIAAETAPITTDEEE